MPAPKKAKRRDLKAAESIELDSDAWPKFEALIRNAAKTPPKPREQKKARRDG
jgi:hypothetical protein